MNEFRAVFRRIDKIVRELDDDVFKSLQRIIIEFAVYLGQVGCRLTYKPLIQARWIPTIECLIDKLKKTSACICAYRLDSSLKIVLY